jgi:cell division protein FtsI (penicillin-binding protein 3)
MGAKDAVYLLESRGLRVQMNGYGRVVQQSIPAYSAIRRGEVIGIQLRP